MRFIKQMLVILCLALIMMAGYSTPARAQDGGLAQETEGDITITVYPGDGELDTEHDDVPFGEAESADKARRVTASTPSQSGRNISGVGSVRGTGSAGTLVVKLQTNVCGLWGCSWRTMSEVSAYVGRNAERSITVRGICRNGSHEYRTLTTFSVGSISAQSKRRIYC